MSSGGSTSSVIGLTKGFSARKALNAALAALEQRRVGDAHRRRRPPSPWRRAPAPCARPAAALARRAARNGRACRPHSRRRGTARSARPSSRCRHRSSRPNGRAGSRADRCPRSAPRRRAASGRNGHRRRRCRRLGASLLEFGGGRWSAASKPGPPSRRRLASIASSSGRLPTRLASPEICFAATRGLRHQRRAFAIFFTRATRSHISASVRARIRWRTAALGLHDIGRDAAGIDDGVVHARRRRHVLAHIVDADIHQLDGVERAAAEMRRGGRMRGAAVEGEIDLDAGERDRLVDAGEGRRMPADRDVDIVEQLRRAP